ncbi:hypothetical protein ES288_D07G185600v1 [Gossypium darwinii]|uniref:ATPase AAA-type core domain-containing protein n=1 Tax=Gossypium darwinii TaxID=34276 RepID=A0A5D2BX96_GOSDA|nr:hypothetical protein ES288_D07G185600v1 [Gossypium darwinii]
MGQGIPGGLNRQGLPGDKKLNGSDKKDKKFEPAAPPARVGSKQHKQKGSEVVAWLLTVTPLSKCKLQLLKLEQIKDYLLMEEEFVVNQKRLKPQEEKAEEDRFKFDDLRGSSMSGILCHIGGLDAQIQEIKEVVELPLTHPELYEDIGIKPPKGVILYEEPGTNKTLLAKACVKHDKIPKIRAVANSTSVTFLCVVGSELIQKYLGDGPKLVRELFKRTMLELLNQLDDFDFREDVKVILATNRIESIDPALLCPVWIHTSRMTLADDVNLEEFVMTNDEFSGADIKALCIETGLLTLRERRMKVRLINNYAYNVPFLFDFSKVVEKSTKFSLLGKKSGSAEDLLQIYFNAMCNSVNVVKRTLIYSIELKLLSVL